MILNESIQDQQQEPIKQSAILDLVGSETVTEFEKSPLWVKGFSEIDFEAGIYNVDPQEMGSKAIIQEFMILVRDAIESGIIVLEKEGKLTKEELVFLAAFCATGVAAAYHETHAEDIEDKAGYSKIKTWITKIDQKIASLKDGFTAAEAEAAVQL